MSSNDSLKEPDKVLSAQQLAQQKRSRRNLLLVLAVFALPVILAKLALMDNWLDYGVTNQGELVKNEQTLSQYGLDVADFDHKWLMLYGLPAHCDSLCEQSLEKVHNTYVALGKEMPRITPILLHTQPFSSTQMEGLSKSQWQILTMPIAAKNQINKAEVLVVDPLGNIVLKYLLPTESSALSQFGKQILTDMKKLLKYSRIG